MKLCPTCGNQCKDENKYCTKCGSLLGSASAHPAEKEQQPSEKSQPKKNREQKNGLVIGMIVALIIVLIVIGVAAAVLLKKSSEINVSSDSGWEELPSEDAEKEDFDTKDSEVENADMDQQDEAPAAEDASDVAAADMADDATEEETEDMADEAASNDYTTHRYEIVVDDVSWSQAQRDCMTRGGHLVTFDSREELDAVLDMIDRQMDEHYSYYIGASRDSESEEYYWQDQKGRYYGGSINPEDCDWLRSQWLKDEPSFVNTDDQKEECYVDLIYVGEKWVLNDVPGNLEEYSPGKVAYVIEWDE